MSDREIDELKEAAVRVARASEWIRHLLANSLKREAGLDPAVFNVEWQQAWAEHKDATLRLAELEGVPARRAELKWRDFRASLDAAVAPLSDAERDELDPQGGPA